MSETHSSKALVPAIRFKGFTDVWKRRKLGEVLTVNSGKDYKSLSPGKIPVYGTGGFMLNVDRALSMEDAIGIGRKGTINHPMILRAPFWTVDTLFFMKPLQSYSLLFLYSWCQNNNWKKYDESTGVPSLSKKTIDSVPMKVASYDEQKKIGDLFGTIDSTIASNQRKGEILKGLKKALLQKIFVSGKEVIPDIRFSGYTDAWERRKFSSLYEKVVEKNDLSFTSKQIISVANMYYKMDSKRSDDAYMKTYNVFRIGDIAFEGNKSKHFSYGRFVENTIGNGIVSHVFDVFRPKASGDLNYWKYAIHNENFMGGILRKVTTHSTMMTNLVAKDFLKESISVPSINEQKNIGKLLVQVDTLIATNQRKTELLQTLKKALFQKMFV